MAEVVISVRSELDRIIGDMKKLQEQAGHVGDKLSKSTEDLGKGVKDQGTNVSNFLKSLQDLGRRTADQLRSDFKTLFSLEALKKGLDLGKSFEKTIQGGIEVGNTIRKLGPIFGMAESAWTSFQTKLIKGLGQIGLGAEEANNALMGLAKTQVRGEGNLTTYARSAGELASLGGEKGNEGGIAKGIADALQSQGKDQNDPAAFSAMVQAVHNTMRANGSNASSALGMMSGAFSGMSNEDKHRMTAGGLGKIAAVSGTVGDLSALASSSLSGRFHDSNIVKGASGFNGLIGPNGINFDILDKMKKIVNRLPGDKVAALGTAGFDEQSARQALNLMDLEPQAKKKQAGYGQGVSSLDADYSKSRGLGETAQGAVNKTASFLAGPIAEVTKKATDVLQDLTKTNAGAAAVTVGGGVLAAMLTGGGIAGLGKGLLGSMRSVVTAKGIEGATGEKVQLVSVVNWPEGGLGSGSGGVVDLAKKAIPLVATAGAGMVALGAGAAAGVAALANEFIAGPIQRKKNADFANQKAAEAAANDATETVSNAQAHNMGGRRTPEEQAAFEKALVEQQKHLQEIAHNTGKTAQHAKETAQHTGKTANKPAHGRTGSTGQQQTGGH
jgi:hypothetical protein